jgi:energy-coupling factor transporter ATP-binding protein EcfA2
MATNSTLDPQKPSSKTVNFAISEAESRLSQAKSQIGQWPYQSTEVYLDSEPELDFEYNEVIEFEEVPIKCEALNAQGERMMSVFTFLSSPSEIVHTGRDSDTEKRLAKLLARLRTTGKTRPLKRPKSDWKHKIHDLIDVAPNFEKLLLSIVWPELELTSRGLSQRMPPVLLVGPPGCGKTFIAKEIAKLMNSASLFIDMGAETNGSTLAGSSTFFSNSSPGLLFQSLAFGVNGQKPEASIVCILDEVDKACDKSSSLTYDPIAALYSLLEEDTAEKFSDQSVPDVQINASRVRFILLANSTESIPEPILSRVIQFDLEAPSVEQTKKIARNMLSSIVDSLGIDFSLELPLDVLEFAAMESPRRCKTRLKIAVAYSVAANLDQIDLKSWLISDIGRKKQQRRMGFMS